QLEGFAQRRLIGLVAEDAEEVLAAGELLVAPDLLDDLGRGADDITIAGELLERDGLARCHLPAELVRAPELAAGLPDAEELLGHVRKPGLLDVPPGRADAELADHADLRRPPELGRRGPIVRRLPGHGVDGL